jgi:hypothetical protein
LRLPRHRNGGDAIRPGARDAPPALIPTKDGFRVRLAGGTIAVTDGPFVKTKEVVGGYALVEAKSRDAALTIARELWSCIALTGPRSKANARCARSRRVRVCPIEGPQPIAARGCA